MKVAYDYQAFTMQAFGGISRYYQILATEMLNLHQDVSVLAGLHCNNYLRAMNSEVVKGTKLSRYPFSASRIFGLINHAFSELSIKYRMPDVIHETYYSSLPRLKSESFRITTVYDMIHELFPENFSVKDKTSDRKKLTLSRVDHIICISESTKRDLINIFGIAEEKLSVVHLGVDLSAFVNAKSEPGITVKPYLLYVGGRAGYKNFYGLLEAFASSRMLRSDFDVVAFGGGAFTGDELMLLKDYGFRDKQVRQVSGDDQRLSLLYSNARAFVYPSLYEGFGLPPLEAMASGCPVVSSNSSSMPEVIGVSGEYFVPSSIEDMRGAIERVAYSDQRRSELINLGFDNVSDFSWQSCAKRTLEVYNRAANKR